MVCPNADSIAVWNEILVPKFKKFREVFVTAAATHSDPAVHKHAPRAGDRALDLGCGFGETSIDLARRVGANGSVVGFDCCEAFLDVGRADAKKANVGNLSFVCGDAQTHVFEGNFDYVFARFGTMFFASPVAAMRNVRKAMKPGARALILTWRSIEDNAWVHVPKKIAQKHLPPPGDDARTCGPGPFSWAGEETVRDIMTAAGFVDVALERSDRDFLLGRNLAEAIDAQLQLGPAGEIVREAGELGEKKRPELVADLERELARWAPDGAVRMPSSAWWITARVPA
jgi:ubiquinone/menaquinone biosynthesis C-methylase UbiE